MLKKYKECLVYEPVGQEEVSQVELCRIREKKIPGILPLFCIKRNGKEVLLFGWRGLVPLEEIISSLNQKQFLKILVQMLDLLQIVKEDTALQLNHVMQDPQYFYYDLGKGNLYIAYLSVCHFADNQNWEQNLKMSIQTLMNRNGFLDSQMGRSISILLHGRIVVPENLRRNIEMIVKKMGMPLDDRRDYGDERQDSEKETCRREFEEVLQRMNRAYSDPILETEVMESLPEQEMESLNPQAAEKEAELQVKEDNLFVDEVTEKDIKKTLPTAELNWEDRMNQSPVIIEHETPEQGIVIRRRKEEEQTSGTADENTCVERVVSGKLKPQIELEGKENGTQVLRKNIWQQSGQVSGDGGFQSVNPLRLNEQYFSDSGEKKTKSDQPKELHFVSFGLQEPRIDFKVNKNYFVIGKLESSDGVINYTPTISRIHCAIHKTEDGIYIEDMGSANHTYVNNRELIPYERVKITPEDTIRLAKENFSIQYK